MTIQGSCWTNIGTYGDRSCKELSTVETCRECPVYARAGKAIFHRVIETPEHEGSLESQAVFATPVAEEQGVSHIIFKLGGEIFALTTSLIVAVQPQVQSHRIPQNVEPALRGLINWNGRVIPCVDLASVLGVHHVQSSGGKGASKTVIYTYAQKLVALDVDEVIGVEILSPVTCGEFYKLNVSDQWLSWKSSRVPRISAQKLDDALGRIIW